MRELTLPTNDLPVPAPPMRNMRRCATGVWSRLARARSDLAAAACLDAADAAKLALARKEGRTADVERLLKKARKAFSDRG